MLATRAQVVPPSTTPCSTPRRMPSNSHQAAISLGGATLLPSFRGPHPSARARVETAIRVLQRTRWDRAGSVPSLVPCASVEDSRPSPRRDGSGLGAGSHAPRSGVAAAATPRSRREVRHGLALLEVCRDGDVVVHDE